MRLVHVFINCLIRKFFSAHVAPVATACAGDMIAAAIFNKWNHAPRTMLNAALLGALSCTLWMPVAAVRAPFFLTLVTLVEEWILIF